MVGNVEILTFFPPFVCCHFLPLHPFLAIVHALALFRKEGINLPIYSDSKNAIDWVRHKKCKTKLVREERSSKLFDLIERAETWLQNNEYTNEILKWETEAWGEIPADFGRK
jgi:ribonuclease HI